VNRPGAAAATDNGKGFDATPLNCTTMVVLKRPLISYGTITLIWLAETKIGVPGLLSNITWTPARLEATAPEEFTEKSTPAAGLEGPRKVPLMASSSPGAIGPAAPVALLRIMTG